MMPAWLPLAVLVAAEGATLAAVTFGDVQVAATWLAAIAAGVAGLVYLAGQVGRLMRWGKHIAGNLGDVADGQVSIARQLGATQADVHQLRTELHSHVRDAAERDQRIVRLTEKIERNTQ